MIIVIEQDGSPLRELTDLGKRVYRNARPPRYAKPPLTRYTGRYKL